MKRIAIFLGFLLILASISSKAGVVDIPGNDNGKYLNTKVSPLMAAPSIVADQSFTIDENPAAGYSFGIIDTTSNGGNAGTLVWTITSNIDPNGDLTNAFEITQEGELKVLDPGDFNFEVDSDLEIEITVTDTDASFSTQTVTVNLNDVNEFTPVVNAESFEIAENIANGAPVGTLGATDGDGTTTYSSWTITAGNTSSDLDADLPFAIDASTGEITINDSGDIDFETTKSYTLKVTVSDGENTSDEQDVTITVTDVNDNAPVITTDNFSIDENPTDEDVVGTLSAEDLDEGSSFSNWTLSTTGNDSNDNDGNRPFRLDAATGNLIVNDAGDFDYETVQSFTLRVTVSDGENPSAEKEITVTINNVNDIAPVINDASFEIAEDITNNTEVGTLGATDGDDDGSGVTTYSQWTITGGNTSTDTDIEPPFAIDASTGIITINNSGDIDYETTPTYTLQVTVSDGENPSEVKEITITVTDVNDGAPVINDTTLIISEYITDSEQVGILLATDDDAGTTFSEWTILNDGNTSNDGDTIRPFIINPSTGEITINDSGDIDFETKQSYTLQVTVSDGTLTSDIKNISILITDENDELPVITTDTLRIDENPTDGAPVGTLEAQDLDAGSSFSGWTLSDTGNPDSNNNQLRAFILDPNSGKLSIRDSKEIDYENIQSYTLRVTVSDGKNPSEEKEITVNINNLNDIAPIIADTSFIINENIANETPVGTLSATDIDGPELTNFQSWIIIDGNPNTNQTGEPPFKINENTGEITISDTDDIDFETSNSFTLQVRVSDGARFSEVKEITINVTDVNDGLPVINDAGFTITEDITDGATVGTLTATDNDAGTIFSEWTILDNYNTSTDGDTIRPFIINPTTGEITINDSGDIDFETTQNYTLQVTVSDGENQSAIKNINIEVSDKNDNIPVINVQSFTIDENINQDLEIGTLIAEDNDTLTVFQNWTIAKEVNIGNDGDTIRPFRIDENTGKISINDAGDIDYETTQSYNLKVTVSDGINTSAPAEIVIKINDVNDNTPIITDPTIFTIRENSPIDTVIGQLQATDADITPTVFQNWSIVENVDPDGDGTQTFYIDPSTGDIILKDTNDINYELNQSHTINVSVSDGVNTSDTIPILININNVNDLAPIVSPGQEFSVAENSAIGSTIGRLLATDTEPGTVLQNWTITQNVDSNTDGNLAFSIDANTGDLLINDSTEFNAEVNTQFTIKVTVSDGDFTSAEETVVINITNVNDIKPIITAGQTFSINENAENDTPIGVVVATDGDISGTSFNNWTIVENINRDGDNQDAYDIDESTGEITVNDPDDLNFEISQIDTIKITVRDNTTGFITSDTTEVIINLNDLNDVTPVITPNQLFTIDENLAKESIVGTILATDGDITVTALRDWATGTILDPNGNDTTAFVIDSVSGVIKVNDPKDLDFETNTTFKLSITVSDSVNVSSPAEITIQLRDLKDIVPIITEGQTFTIDENMAKDSLVGTVLATDGDATPTVFQNWTIAENVDPNDNGEYAFAINENDGRITVLDSTDLDYEQDTTFTIKLTVSDGENTSIETDVVINLNDLNDILPVVTPGQLFTIDENIPAGSLVDTIVATDADFTETTFSKWTISTNIDPNGNGNMAFEIDSVTGIITVNDSLDIDREANEMLEIFVTVFDGTNTSLPEKVTIKLNDKNDVVPVVNSGYEFTIQENTAKGTLLGILEATDGDVTPTTFNTWTISTNSDADNDGNLAFALDTITGELTINDIGDIDYEKNMDITIEVTVSDSVNTSLAQQVIIHLTDLNDVLPEITKGQAFIVSEDVDNAVSVGIIEATDGDISPTTFSQWTITTNVDPDKDGIPTFNINPENGELFINDADEIDFEDNDKFFIAVSVFDGVNTGIPRVITVYIDNIDDEVPVITPNQVFHLKEDAVKRTLIGIVEATDKDKGMLTLQDWTIHNNPDHDDDGIPAFKIDDETGELTVQDTDDIDYELSNEYKLVVTVSDGTNTSEVENVVVKIDRVLSVNNEIKLEFKIYPNPVVDYLTLTTKAKGRLFIINDKGQYLKQMNINDYQTEISVQDLNSGIYYLVFTSNKTRISKKIIVKNR